MSPKLLVRAKVNNGSSLSSDELSSSRCICNVNSYNFLDRTNSFFILFFIFLLLLFFDDADTVDANDKACKCNVNAKLYITIIRNFVNNSGENWDDSSISMGLRKTKCLSFRDVAVEVEATVSGDGDDDSDEVLDGVVVVSLSLILFVVSIDLF